MVLTSSRFVGFIPAPVGVGTERGTTTTVANPKYASGFGAYNPLPSPFIFGVAAPIQIRSIPSACSSPAIKSFSSCDVTVTRWPVNPRCVIAAAPVAAVFQSPRSGITS